MEATYERADVADSFVDPECAGQFLDALHDESRIRCASASPGLGSDGLVARSAGRVDEARACLAELRRAVARRPYWVEDVRTRYGRLHRCCLRVGRRALCRNRRGSTRRRSRGRRDGPTSQNSLRTRMAAGEEFGATIRRIGGELPVERHLRGRPRLSKAGRSRRANVQRPGARRNTPSRALAVRPSPSRRRMPSPDLGLPAARLLEGIGDQSDIARLRGFAKRQRKLRGASAWGASCPDSWRTGWWSKTKAEWRS